VPDIRVNGVRLYYEDHGSGEPLLFISGLGGHIGEIPYLVDSYSRELRFIAYDNRGCGRSDKPEHEYTIPGFADDAAALLDGLHIDNAIVYGSSMGGMVAQELVLRHPGNVRALILGCTTAGAVRGVQPSPETVQALVRNQSLAGDEALEAGWALGYSADWIAANREALFARSRTASQHAAPRESYMRQVIAAARHDTYDRLDQIACPVMIIHGANDVMIPPGNAGMLAEAIPHAEVHILDGLGHGYNLEGQAIADALVLDFVRRVGTGEAATKATADSGMEGSARAIR
jgi:pimeloyl-ACP methyl ester carboxylesterase